MGEAEFVREIKGYRFSSYLRDSHLHLTLFNLHLDEFYETAYQDHSLPESARKYFSTVAQLHFYISEKTKIFKLLAPGVVMCAQYMGRVEKFITVELRATGREGTGYMDFLKRYCRQLVEENGAVRTQLRGRETDYESLETENKRLRKLLEERSKDMERLKEEMEVVRNRKRNSRKEKDSPSKDSRDSKEKEIKEATIKREVLPEEAEQRVIVPPKRRKSRTSPRRVVKQDENTEFGPDSDEEDTPRPRDPSEEPIFDEESSPVS
jgi:hypothetical protein